MSGLSIQNLSMRFELPNGGAVQALEDVSLDLKAGELMSVLGPSGCGKTTLLNIAAGFLAPTSGKLIQNGHEVTGPDAERGMVFQKGALFEWMSVRENVGFGPSMKGMPNAEKKEIVDHLLDVVGLQDFKEKAVYELSGGMQQRVALARCLANDPDVILMDLNMPRLGGLSATEMILERLPETRIVILTMHDSPEYISTALNHGALGYILKDVPTEEIKQAIDTVMSGERYLCTGAQGSLEPKDGETREALTGREQTILLELAQGKSNKEVALVLDISVRTVETHRKNIKRKLGISSTAGLTRYAMEHGVLQGTGVRL